MNFSVSRRYARALFEVAVEEGAAGKSGLVDELHGRLTQLAAAFEGSAELRLVADDPQCPRESLRAIMEQVLSRQGPELAPLTNLVRLLVDRRRLTDLPQIARIYGQLADEQAGRVRGRVTSAVPLPPETVERLEAALERITQREVVLDTRTDPSLLGGVSTQLGSTLYDGSLRNQLEQLRRSLKVG